MYILGNGRLITRSQALPYLENGAVCIDGTKIKAVGETAALRAGYPEAEFLDARGGVIMPAFINAHTHIYSALARGLSIKGNNPTNFYEVLDGTWWAIDRKLTLKGTKASADALYIDCIKQGVTTIFDHHASYCEIPGSLFQIAESADEAIATLDIFLDNAMMANLASVRIIHGKGTGVLRKAVQDELKRNRCVKRYRLGVYGEGEDGVTIAELA